MRRILPVLAALAIAGSANAATIVNGSFEIGIPDPGSFATVPAGGSNIDGWTVGGAGVDYIGSYWVSQDGARSLDLSALTAGSVSQDIATDIGTTYVVSFYMSGNPDGAPDIKTLTASAGSTSANYNVDTSTFATPDLVWTRYTLRFTALAAATTLTFGSADDSPWGPALDNITIAAVPEASTWGMLIAGLGLVGMASRRRRPTVAA